MPTIDIDFDWNHAFEYELGTSKKGPVIRQKGARLERIWPLRIHETLYLDFARLDGSPQVCLDFCRRWGFLHNRLAGKGAEEEIDLWRHEIALMRGWIQALGVDGAPAGFLSRQKVASVELLFETHPLGRRAILLRPITLMDAMLLQLAQAQAGGGSIATCQQCGKWFEVGAEGKRKVAKFCSDQCRNRFNYERRTQK